MHKEKRRKNGTLLPLVEIVGLDELSIPLLRVNFNGLFGLTSIAGSSMFGAESNVTSFFRSDFGFEHLSTVPKYEPEEVFYVELTSLCFGPCMWLSKLSRGYFAKYFCNFFFRRAVIFEESFLRCSPSPHTPG